MSVKTIHNWRVTQQEGGPLIQGRLAGEDWTTNPLVAIFGLLVRAEGLRHLPWSGGSGADVSALLAAFPPPEVPTAASPIAEDVAGDPPKTVSPWRVVRDGDVLRLEGTIDGQPYKSQPLVAVFGLLVKSATSVRHLPWKEGSAADVLQLITTFPPPQTQTAEEDQPTATLVDGQVPPSVTGAGTATGVGSQVVEPPVEPGDASDEVPLGTLPVRDPNATPEIEKKT
jgi:hypothetical protein